MERVLARIEVPSPDCPLTFPQHYNAKHRFECPECDDEFTTEEARDEVRSFSAGFPTWH